MPCWLPRKKRALNRYKQSQGCSLQKRKKKAIFPFLAHDKIWDSKRSHPPKLLSLRNDGAARGDGSRGRGGIAEASSSVGGTSRVLHSMGREIPASEPQRGWV